jgi:hypothetical protein
MIATLTLYLYKDMCTKWQETEPDGKGIVRQQRCKHASAAIGGRNSGRIFRDETCNSRRAFRDGVFYAVSPKAIYRGQKQN